MGSPDDCQKNRLEELGVSEDLCFVPRSEAVDLESLKDSGDFFVGKLGALDSSRAPSGFVRGDLAEGNESLSADFAELAPMTLELVDLAQEASHLDTWSELRVGRKEAGSDIVINVADICQ